MQKRFLMASLLLIILTSNARADDPSNDSCTPVDLRRSKCLPPLKNQSDTNFCFAFAAAEAISFRLCKEVSPVALGIATPKEGKPGTQQIWGNGAWPGDAIQAGNKNGFCLEQEVPSQLLFNDQNYALQAEYAKLKGRIAKLRGKPCDQDLDKIKRVLPAAQMADIVKYIGSRQSNKDFTKLVTSSCKHPLKEKVSVKSCEGEAHNKLRFVSENISEGPIPLGIMQTSATALSFGGFDNAHAVTVVGRKYENGICKYLIRDSGANAYVMGSFDLGGRDDGPERWVTEGNLLLALQTDKSTCNAIK